MVEICDFKAVVELWRHKTLCRGDTIHMLHLVVSDRGRLVDIYGLGSGSAFRGALVRGFSARITVLGFLRRWVIVCVFELDLMHLTIVECMARVRT